MLQLRIISVSAKPPAWLRQGFEEYKKRLSPICTLDLIEVPLEKRGTQKNTQPFINREGEKILSLLKAQHLVVALDLKGKSWSTTELAQQFEKWQLENKNIDFIIGGPDGLANACLQRATVKWSLSPLTLPHLFVRLIVVEQLYRAWSILQGHPYHK